jgi:Family of unknown function (DUF6194)
LGTVACAAAGAATAGARGVVRKADNLTESEIIEFVTGSLAGVDVVVASEANGAPEVSWGDTFFFYDPGGKVPADRRIPFATIVTNDYEGFDSQSDLNRQGVFRVNIWVSKETFQGLFGTSGTDVYDFSALDTPLPHPVYWAQSWVSVLNPGPVTSDLTRSLLTEAHERAIARHKRQRSRKSGEG